MYTFVYICQSVIAAPDTYMKPILYLLKAQLIAFPMFLQAPRLARFSFVGNCGKMW